MTTRGGERLRAGLLSAAGAACGCLPAGLRRFLKPVSPACSRFLKRVASSIKEEKVVRTPFGFLMHINYADLVERNIALGLYESDYAKRFAAEIHPGDAVVDVGAYCGYFTMIASGKTGPGGVVYAFEPVAQSYERLVRNVDLNHAGNVIVFHQGVSDKAGRLVMHVPVGLPSQASVAEKNWAEISRGGDWEKREVEASFTALDDLVRDEKIRKPDVVKIDAEGAEVKVLRGMRRLLASSNPVLFMEIVPDVLEQAGDSLDELLEILRGTGFLRIHAATQNKVFDLCAGPLEKAKSFVRSGGYTFIIRKI